jgi:ABC-2 type transport system ATP-binding protein
MEPLFRASHVSKRYGGRAVLKDVDLVVNKGEAIAIVGENGCGKSTLLRILAGVTKPSGGSVTLSPKAKAGFIPDRYEKINMKAAVFLSHMAAMEGKRPGAAEGLCRAFFLDGMLDTPMKYLSKGALQKVAAVQALIGERDILFVDEPLSGQDAASRANFTDEILKRKQSGTAVVMACHEPYLIEKIADSILQIKNGALTDGTEYLFMRAQPRCVFLLEYSGGASGLMDVLKDEIRESASVTACGRLLRLEADRSCAVRLMRLLLAKNAHIVKFEEI